MKKTKTIDLDANQTAALYTFYKKFSKMSPLYKENVKLIILQSKTAKPLQNDTISFIEDLDIEKPHFPVTKQFRIVLGILLAASVTTFYSTTVEQSRCKTIAKTLEKEYKDTALNPLIEKKMRLEDIPKKLQKEKKSIERIKKLEAAGNEVVTVTDVIATYAGMKDAAQIQEKKKEKMLQLYAIEFGSENLQLLKHAFESEKKLVQYLLELNLEFETEFPIVQKDIQDATEAFNEYTGFQLPKIIDSCVFEGPEYQLRKKATGILSFFPFFASKHAFELWASLLQLLFLLTPICTDLWEEMFQPLKRQYPWAVTFIGLIFGVLSTTRIYFIAESGQLTEIVNKFLETAWFIGKFEGSSLNLNSVLISIFTLFLASLILDGVQRGKKFLLQ